MSRNRMAALVAAALFVIVAALFLNPSREQQVRGHTRGWRESIENTLTGRSIPLFERVRHFVQRPRGMSPSVWMSPSMYWTFKREDHERSLLRLGYLTNCEFRLTNQVITRAFSSNFFRLISQRAGTNDDQVWICRSYLTNLTGISPTFPVKDYGVWEQTFRECAVLYASNLLPASLNAYSPR